MKQTTLASTFQRIIRKSILFALFAIAVYALFCTPLDESPTWFRDLLISKMICVAAFASMAFLNKTWEENK